MGYSQVAGVCNRYFLTKCRVKVGSADFITKGATSRLAVRSTSFLNFGKRSVKSLVIRACFSFHYNLRCILLFSSEKACTPISIV